MNKSCLEDRYKKSILVLELITTRAKTRKELPKTKRQDEVVKLEREAWCKRVLILMFEKKQHGLEVLSANLGRNFQT